MRRPVPLRGASTTASCQFRFAGCKNRCWLCVVGCRKKTTRDFESSLRSREGESSQSACAGQYHFVAPVPLRGLQEPLLVVRCRLPEKDNERFREFAALTRRTIILSSVSLPLSSSRVLDDLLALPASYLCQELGREASERRTALLLSKDGSTILDEGRRAALPLFMLFSENVSLRSSNLRSLPIALTPSGSIY